MKSLASLVLLGQLLHGSCACDPCSEETVAQASSLAGDRARLVVRGCGATTQEVLAVYISDRRVLVLPRDAAVGIEWTADGRLVVDVPSNLAERELRYGDWELADRIVVRRLFPGGVGP